MIKSKKCKICKKTYPSHFFVGDVCIPCTVKAKEKEKNKNIEPSK